MIELQQIAVATALGEIPELIGLDTHGNVWTYCYTDSESRPRGWYPLTMQAYRVDSSN
jgi:hypothetical protein